MISMSTVKINKEKIKNTIESRELGVNSMGLIRHYSVLVPLVYKEDEWYILFERRSETIKQANDICFPGGRVEPKESFEVASIREAQEELLLNDHQVEVLGQLDFYIANTQLIIHPFLGIIHDYQSTFFKDEVSDIHLIKLSDLLNHEPEIYGAKFLLQLDDNFPYEKIEGGKSYPWRQNHHQFLFYSMGDIHIWGMTAQILKSVLQLLRECD